MLRLILRSSDGKNLERAAGGLGDRLRALLQVHAYKLRERARRHLLRISRESKYKGNPLQKRSARSKLSASLWAKESPERSRHRASYLCGWRSAYGAVMEWGPGDPSNRSGWLIAPGVTSSVLRWWNPGSGTIRYSSGPVWHPWDETQKRPHWNPALDEQQDEFFEDMGRFAEMLG